MAKQSGLGDNFYVGGSDLSGTICAIKKIGGGATTIDVTAVNQSAQARLPGLRDGSFSFTTLFDPIVEHPVLAALPVGEVIATYARGTVIGGPAASCNGKQLNYNGTRDNKGAFTLEVDVISDDYGIEWGNLLTAGVRSDTVATTPPTGVDFIASSSFGWQAYLHVFSLIGTSVTIGIADSSDNVAFTNLSNGTFAAMTQPGAQRIASASPIAPSRQYTRVSTAGTFTQCSFAVVFVKNDSVGGVF